MKNEAILNKYIYNGNVYSVEDEIGFKRVKSPSIYEVIRIIDGIPLFFEEHLERMRKSAKLLNFHITKSDEEILMDVYRLIKENNCYNLNVKLLYSNGDSKEQEIFLVYFIKSYYPEKDIYEKGVHTILFNSKRENPNAKVINLNLKERINEELNKNNAFEALLVNEEGYITEGSRSNIFFVKENTVYTAPGGTVLLGVTRKHIVEICNKIGIDLLERNIHINEINNFEGLFMTGTSIDVLPIKSIGDKEYNSVKNKIIRKIGDEYLEEVNIYINSKTKK